MEFLRKIYPYRVWIFFAMAVCMAFIHNDHISLWDQDEGAYAGFGKNMAETGDCLIPDFFWSDVHRKPPLHFWNISLSMLLFGVNEFAVRFSSAIFIVLTYALMYFGGKSLWGEKIALLSAVIVSTTFLVSSLAKVAVTDATLLFFTTGCAFALIHTLEKPSIKWTLFFWFCFAMALLTKGPPIIIFTGGMGLILLILHPDRKHIIRLHPWLFLPIALLPLMIWGYFAWQQDGGEFITWMLDFYIFKRVGTKVIGQTAPPGVHLLGIMGFFLLWLMFIPGALQRVVRDIFRDKGTGLLLASWFVAAWLIYEFSLSKLPAYVIGAHVPLAIMIARMVWQSYKEETRPHRLWAIIHFVLVGILIAGLIIAPVILQMPGGMQWTFGITGAGLMAAMAWVIFQFRKKSFFPALTGFNLLFMLSVTVILLPQIDPLKNSTERVGEYVAAHANPESEIIIANNFGKPPSLPFYLSLHFANIREVYHYDDLRQAFQDDPPTVLILDLPFKERFEKDFGKVSFEQITSFSVDRKGRADYYILFNEKGRMK